MRDLTRKSTRPNRTMRVEQGLYVVENGKFEILNKDWDDPASKYRVYQAYMPLGARRKDLVLHENHRTVYWERRRFVPNNQNI